MQNRINNIDQLDFIKGFAALSVILLHTIDKEHLISSLAYYHIWQAVPLFILISFFLLFKKTQKTICDKTSLKALKTYYSSKNIIRLIKRVILPFLYIEILLISLIFLTKGIDKGFEVIFQLGIGPGSYYPFLYLQIWLFSPLLYLLFKNKGIIIGGFIVIIINILANIFCYYFIPQDFIYSRLLTRYLILSFLAYCWIEQKYNLVILTILAIISVFYLSSLGNVNYSPFLDMRWGSQQLPAFFYTFIFALFLFKAYDIIEKKICKPKFILWVGKNSYEVFLLQMFFISTLSNSLIYYFLPVNAFGRFLYVLTIFAVCIFSTYIWQILRERKIFTFKNFIKCLKTNQ